MGEEQQVEIKYITQEKGEDNMKYGVSVYYDKELMDSGRISMENLENKAIEAYFIKISEQLKESIAKSVKEQLKSNISEEIHLTYDLQDFINERKEEQQKNIKHV